MSMLGALAVFDIASSSIAEATRPATPGVASASNRTSTSESSRQKAAQDQLNEYIENSLLEAVRSAEFAAHAARNSTTLATLAQAYNSAGNLKSAVEKAREALEICLSQTDTPSRDPMAARLSLQVLIQAGYFSEVLAYAQKVPMTEQFRLELATILAERSKFDEAQSEINRVHDANKDSTLGYILIAEGKIREAIPHLRATLREFPTDADAALNLSIALWRSGSKRASLAAARRAKNSAAGREDILCHYIDALLTADQPEVAEKEIDRLLRDGLAPSARLQVLHARAKLGNGKLSDAIKLLQAARDKAANSGESSMLAEVESNLIRIRVHRGQLSRDSAVSQLFELHQKYPTVDSVVANIGQVAWRVKHAAILRLALANIENHTFEERAAFLNYQLSTLEGNSSAATASAVNWVHLEPENPHAVTAVMVAMGIGEERWAEAARFALESAKRGPTDRAEINNIAYVLAMASQGETAVEILRPHAHESYILKATLGLAYLSSGEISLGMKLYREAAFSAEQEGDDSRSLMSAYQALVVRQLGLLDSVDGITIRAQALPPVPLPPDWADRPEFVRLREIADRHGYGWPLVL